MFPCTREPMCLSVNMVCMHLLFCKGPSGMWRNFLHVFPSVSVCGRGVGGRQLAYLPGWEPSSEPRGSKEGAGAGEGRGGLCWQCECVMCHPVLPYIHTTTPAACSAAVASRPVVFQVIALKHIAASVLFSLTYVTLHWFCVKPAPLILSLTIRNPLSLLLPSHPLTRSPLWVMSPHACLGQWGRVNSIVGTTVSLQKWRFGLAFRLGF